MLYKDMSDAQLRAARKDAQLTLASNTEATERALAHGMPHAGLRSDQLARHWRERLRLIEAVARSRGLAL